MKNIRVCALKNNLTVCVEGAYLSYALTDGRTGARQTGVEVILTAQGQAPTRIYAEGENNYQVALPRLTPMTDYRAVITATTEADGVAQTETGECAFRTEPDYATLPAKWIECPTPEGVLSPAHAGYESEKYTDAFARPYVTVDLGKVESAEYAVIYGARPFDVPCQPDAPGLKFPLAFTLESATKADFSDAVTVYKSANPYPNPGNQPTFFPLSAPLRYLRFTADELQKVGENAYALALEQIMVLRGLENLAEGATVTADTSIENEFYGKQKLTDGSTEFHPAGRAKKLAQPQFFRPFTVKKGVKSAYLYTTALGLYEAKLNGEKVGNACLAPEWTEYTLYSNVLCHDVTAALKEGENLMEVQAADGWYAGRIGMANVFGERVLRGIYGGDRPKIWAYLTLTYENGETQALCTDTEFLCTAEGALRASDTYDGEIYDARREITGEDFPRLKAEGLLTPARVFETQAKPLSQLNEPIRVIRKHPEVSRHVGADGRLVLDFGVNFAGVATFEIDLPKDAVVRFIYSQHLRADGTCYVANMRGAKVIDTFVSAGKKVRYTPRFTYRGFRYVSVLGADSNQIPFAEGLQLSSDMESIATYEFDNEVINKYTEATVNTLRSTLVGTQTDVPDRDERLPWNMEGYHNSMYFLNSTPFFIRHAKESHISPCPEGKRPSHAPRALNMYGMIVGIEVKNPLLMYYLTGRTQEMEMNYETNKAQLALMQEKFPEGIIALGGTPDWLNADMIDAPELPPEGAQITYREEQTFRYAENLEIMAKTARILGKEKDAEEFEERRNAVKRAIREKLMTPEGKTVSDTQTSYAMLLFNGLVDAEEIPTVAKWYYEAIQRYDDRLSCGVYWIDQVLGALTMLGDHDLALKLAFQDRFPSFGYMISQGANSIWERWDTYLHTRPAVHEKLRWQAAKGSHYTFINEAGSAGISMNSFNHLEMTSSDRFLIERVLGLRLLAGPAASKMAAVLPEGGFVNRAKGEYETARGTVKLAWERANGKTDVQLTVPVGCTLTLYVPCKALTNALTGETVALGGEKVKGTMLPEMELSGKATVTLSAGSYHFLGE